MKNNDYRIVLDNLKSSIDFISVASCERARVIYSIRSSDIFNDKDFNIDLMIKSNMQNHTFCLKKMDFLESIVDNIDCDNFILLCDLYRKINCLYSITNDMNIDLKSIKHRQVLNKIKEAGIRALKMLKSIDSAEKRNQIIFSYKNTNRNHLTLVQFDGVKYLKNCKAGEEG